MRKSITVALVLVSTFTSALAWSADGDDRIFGPTVNPYGLPEGGVAGQIVATGFKKIPADDALNQWSFDMNVGAFESSGTEIPQSQWKNLYLAFAVDFRYLRDCYGAKQSALCTFFHSSVEMSGNLTWNAGPDAQSTDRYQVVLIPIEYVTGTFGKQGPDLRTTNGAIFATVGARAEYLRDLGLEIEHRIIGELTGSINYSSPEQPLGMTTGFRWIGSVRLFVGGGATNVGQIADTQGAIVLGVETQVGIALDLESGTLAFTNTTRHEGDFGLGGAGLKMAMNTERLELKYLHSVCRKESAGGCNAPRLFSYGGGVRYEYVTSSYDGSGPGNAQINMDRSIHRVIFFAEFARF